MLCLGLDFITHNNIICMKGESQPYGVVASIQTPKKSSSKSSLKSKSSKASLRSASGSTVSVKNETTTEVMQCS